MRTTTPHPPAPAGSARRGARIVKLLATVLAGLLLVPTPAAAGEPAAGVGVDLEGLRSFVEASVPVAMAEHDVPGGVFVLVADGEIVVAEGFGQTALVDGTPVDPSRTRFDVGSVAKLVTATAVMQQVELGRLDLDEDVNSYLRTFEIPATDEAPVTVSHLLTHTAGFAERYLVGMWADGPGEAQPLAGSLARHRPSRIRPPGAAHQYSNYGMALAGHLVELVTGQPFEDQVQERILEPLGMVRTTYGRPAGGDTVDAVPHSAMAGPTAALDPAYIGWLPAGGLWTTGEDMAAFMLAHLQGGQHDGARILETATVDTMHRTQFSPHPAVAGLGYGVFGDRHGGLQHGGGWVGTGAHVYLRPDLGVGMFSAFNHDEGPLISSSLHQQIAERFLADASAPMDEVTAATAASTPTNTSGSYAGHYRWNRHDRNSFASVISTLRIQRMQVTEHADGTLSTTMTPVPFIDDTRWHPTGPGVFVEDGGTNVLAFDLDEEGRSIGLHVMGAQLFSMDRVGSWGSAGTTLTLLLATSLVLLLAAIGWPVGALVRRFRHTDADGASELRHLRRLSGLTAVLSIVFVVGLVVHFATDMAGLLMVGPVLRGLLVLPLLAALATAVLAALLGRTWRRRQGQLTTRLYHSVVLVALLGFLPTLYSLNLLGFHL
jgi:CubicO group peptidase (beta-lactamase class C family)